MWMASACTTSGVCTAAPSALALTYPVHPPCCTSASLQTPLATAAPSALARQHSPERSALALQADKSIDDLQQVLARHAEIQQRVNGEESCHWGQCVPKTCWCAVGL